MMITEKLTLRFGVITLIVLFAALSRLIPHPSNFAPVGAIALFGAAHYSRRYLAFIIPIFSMWISDLILNNVVYILGIFEWCARQIPQFILSIESSNE